MFEDLDFSSLKLPIEPKNLIYLYLAYKLINNIDKLNINGLVRNVPRSPVPPSNNNFVFLVLIIVGCIFFFFNNILNRISISSISLENLNQSRDRRCPYRMDNNTCPIRKCPLFANCAEKINRKEKENVAEVEEVEVKESEKVDEN